MKLLDNVALTAIFFQEILSTEILDDLAEAITGTITEKVKEELAELNAEVQESDDGLVIDEDGMAYMEDNRVPEWDTVYMPLECPYKTQYGDKIGVHYYGKLAEEDKEFGSSYRQGEKGIFEFPLTEEGIIPGWLKPLLDMCPGEKRHIFVPSDYAYGDRGTQGIPPDSDIITDVELLFIENAKSERFDMPKRELVAEPTYVPPGCEYHAKEGDTLFMEYHGTLESNGQVFDSSYHRGGTFDYTIGKREAIQGWELGMLGICAGERRHLIIPKDYAYGDQGTGSGSIPPGDSLVQDVKCTRIITADDEEFNMPEEKTIDNQETIYKPIKCVRQPQMGDRVWVAYDGRLENTPDIIFDTSYKFMYGRTHPFVFTIGAHQAIEGFETLIKDLCVGEKAHAVIPPSLAYGRQGDGMIIPPDARLDYMVEVIRIEDEEGKMYTAEPEWLSEEDTKYKNETTGEETDCPIEKTAEINDAVQVNWAGYLQVTMDGFQATENNKPEVIHLGKTEIFKPLQESIIGMCVGEKRQVVIPESHAFGKEGMSELGVPPYATLVYDVELQYVVKEKDLLDHDEL